MKTIFFSPSAYLAKHLLFDVQCCVCVCTLGKASCLSVFLLQQVFLSHVTQRHGWRCIDPYLLNFVLNIQGQKLITLYSIDAQGQKRTFEFMSLILSDKFLA